MTILEPASAPGVAREPHRVARRRAGGPYCWLTPHLEAMAAAESAFARRTLSLPRDETHFIALALAIMGEELCTSDNLAALARAIGRQSRERILGGFAPNAKLARLCGRLAGRPWRAPTYRRLAALWDEPHARKVLAHSPAITRRMVLTLSRLPQAYRTPGVVSMIRRPRDLARMVFAIEIVRRVRTDLTDRQIVASLERADIRYIRDWVEGHYERLPFPKAPVGVLADGRGGVLRPVCSGADLVRVGREFDNSVGGYLEAALSGRAAFYVFEADGRREAVVELRPTPGLGWTVEELKGRGNAELAGETRDRIHRLLEASGVHGSPQSRSRFGWW